MLLLLLLHVVKPQPQPCWWWCCPPLLPPLLLLVPLLTKAHVRRYFAETVIGQWAANASVDSVFVDEADTIPCTWSAGAKDRGLKTIDDV